MGEVNRNYDSTESKRMFMSVLKLVKIAESNKQIIDKNPDNPIKSKVAVSIEEAAKEGKF